MASTGDGSSGQGPGKGGRFKGVRSFFSSLKGKKSSQSSGNATAQRTSTDISPPPAPVEQRRATITDASTVADAFRSGDPSAIRDIMKKHEVRSNLGGDAQSGSHTFGVTDFGLSRDRRDSQGHLREMKTFIIGSNPDHSTPQFQGGYNPMTPRETGWAGTPSQETLNMGNVAFGSQQHTVELTPRLTGCSVVEDYSGATGHVQPFAAQGDISETSAQASLRSATHLKAHKDITAVFGPQEYGRHCRGDHVGSNAVMFKDLDTGDKTIMHQAIYRGDDGKSRITVGQQPFGRRYRMGAVPPPQQGSMTPPAPTTAPQGGSTLQVPNSPHIGSAREPRP